MTTMNNNLYQDLKFKIFRSGNPAFFYIGINTVIFVFFALVNVVFFLSGNTNFDLDFFVRRYFGFPASFEALPYRFYTIITYQFFHDGFLHILFNMLWLYWMGQIFLDFLKPRQFHFVYLGGGILGALIFTGAFHIFPVFEGSIVAASVIGASASVMAIVIATATLVPDFSIRLFHIGDLKLKYLAIAYIVIDLIGTASANAGGSFTHLGGALFGFFYITLLKSGNDWSNLFKRKPKMKVVKNETYRSAVVPKQPVIVNQDEIDSILDKISKSGYDKLSRDEKETLFKASKHS
jgi:membrane associated rhomboid family serine protease